MTISVTQGDCVAVLQARTGPLFDAVICDPPYHLTSIVERFGKGNAAPAQHGTDGAFVRASRGFMGKEWDGGDVAFRPETWRAVYDQMKPGAHLIAFSGTRTYHRMAVAIEDAGFEVRDQLAWIYGSGFPKSHDVAKGIAKRRTEDVEPVRVVCRFVRAAMDEQGLKSRDLTHVFEDCNPRLIDHWAARDSDSQPSLPTPFQWALLVAHLSLHARPDYDRVAAEVARLNDRKGTKGERWTGAEVIGEVEAAAPGFGDKRFNGDRTLRSLDQEAARYEGWGTALKPAWEPICLARKPLIGTVAANVLAHGTGAINVNACRVEGESTERHTLKVMSSKGADGGAYGAAHEYAERDERFATGSPLGRFPANILHDGSDEVEAGFPASSSGNVPHHRGAGGIGNDGHKGMATGNGGALGGESPARFFYSAKAGPLDRLGSEHPTVKPVDVMRWLVRLVTPPGGLILDPFAGSGTTGIAALAEGFDAELIDLEPDHVADIETKLAHLRGEGSRIVERHLKRKAARAKPAAGGLFD